MQILISELKDGLKQDEIKVSPKELLQNLIWRCEGLLEKEKEQIADAWELGKCLDGFNGEEYYNRTFKTNER